MRVVALLLAAGVAGYLLAGFMRRYALARDALDHPNERSSHRMPTPRGGGLAFVISFIGTLILAATWWSLDPHIVRALVVSGLLVAAVGTLDDFRGLGVVGRLVAHLVAAALAVGLLTDWPTAHFSGENTVSAWWLATVAVFLLVWLVNLYNFMDGIDGIASIEAITVGLGMAALYLLHPGSGDAWLAPALLVAAVAGFLPWNFPHARLFMGDSGSGFLGMVLGVMALSSLMLDIRLFWAWVILLGVFVVDASMTLLYRLAARQNVFRAHRNHAYQVVARRVGRHAPVTLAVAAINLLWLLPMAAWVARGGLAGPAGVAIAWTPLVVLAVFFRAGRARD